jgi:AP endonuclease-1
LRAYRASINFSNWSLKLTYVDSGNAFALFLKSQRKWENPGLNSEHATLFKSNCAKHEYNASKHVLPHGSYLVNLAQFDPEKAEQAYKSFIDDLERCEMLGIKLYNFQYVSWKHTIFEVSTLM